MLKLEASQALWHFYNRFIDENCPEICYANSEGCFIKIASSNNIHVELWYEDWSKERKNKVFAICLEYIEEKQFQKDFPYWKEYEDQHKEIFNIKALPESDVLFFQKDKDNHFFAGFYINSNDALRSLQNFFENEKIKSIIEKYGISFNDQKKELATQRIQQILARVGQGIYRQGLEKLWDNACAVTRCNIKETLRASHAKPWRLSSNEERLNSHNGLLLSANYDALFDKGLISFSSLQDGWNIMISPYINNEELKKLGIKESDKLKHPKSLSIADEEEIEKFLSFHRNEIFKK